MKAAAQTPLAHISEDGTRSQTLADHLSGTAAAFAQKLTLHLTLSHEGEYALAFALFEAAGH